MATRSFARDHVDDDDQAAAARDYGRQLKRRGKAEVSEHAESEERERKAHQEGRKAGRTEAKAKKRTTSSKKRPPARRRSSRPTARAARQLRAPLDRQMTSGLKVLGLTLGVTALYLVLENAGAAAGALTGLSRGLEWLRAPDRPIPYGPR
jgi:sRNA-binding protein